MTGAEAAATATSRTTKRTGDLYRRHVADALRVAYLLTGDKAAAEDIVQDAFVRMFGRFENLRKPEAFGFYLRRTVVNLTRDRFRRLKSERTAVLRLGGAPVEDEGTGRVDEHHELLDALQKLPPRQRTAVVLRFCEGLSEDETAQVLGTSSGAVNSLVARGIASLRREIGGASW